MEGFEMNKKEMMKKALEVFTSDRVQKWYSANLEGNNQGNTIDQVGHGVMHGEISMTDGLVILFIIGYQWNEKFEEVP
jgi:hypothetical protein